MGRSPVVASVPVVGQTRALHCYRYWRNQNARHPHLLADQCRERVRVGSEKGIRWGGRPRNPAV
ncbi:integrase [Streptomyces gilvosporeus]|uniref:Integrase n=1 Tax=Streptomyces gilvosporeus TaxID=553510 RepID=A0A1V0TJD8_9ACTN|nr:integrase [Streptomyces gilvosporeus]